MADEPTNCLCGTLLSCSVVSVYRTLRRSDVFQADPALLGTDRPIPFVHYNKTAHMWRLVSGFDVTGPTELDIASHQPWDHEASRWSQHSATPIPPQRLTQRAGVPSISVTDLDYASQIGLTVIASPPLPLGVICVRSLQGHPIKRGTRAVVTRITCYASTAPGDLLLETDSCLEALR